MKAAFIKYKKEKIGYIALIIFGVISFVTVFILSPLEQNEGYHNFSDEVMFFDIHNFKNVISNLPFLLVGLIGFYEMKNMKDNKVQYLVFFFGIIITSIGSSYYHLSPNNFTLIFDRLPMTIVFMSLVSIIVSEFINYKIGQKLLIPIILLGFISVVYWAVFNDLALYAMIQFYPMLVIPIVLIFFKSNFSKTYGYWLLLAFYIIAKLCEHFDEEIFYSLKVISGHSLKHIISSVGLYVLLYTFINREKLAPSYCEQQKLMNFN